MEKQGQEPTEAGGGSFQREQVACNYHLGEWGSKHMKETRMTLNVEGPCDRRDWRSEVRPSPLESYFLQLHLALHMWPKQQQSWL